MAEASERHICNILATIIAERAISRDFPHRAVIRFVGSKFDDDHRPWRSTHYHQHGTLTRFFDANDNFILHRISASKHEVSISESFRSQFVRIYGPRRIVMKHRPMGRRRGRGRRRVRGGRGRGRGKRVRGGLGCVGDLTRRGRRGSRGRGGGGGGAGGGRGRRARGRGRRGGSRSRGRRGSRRGGVRGRGRGESLSSSSTAAVATSPRPDAVGASPSPTSPPTVDVVAPERPETEEEGEGVKAEPELKKSVVVAEAESEATSPDAGVEESESSQLVAEEEEEEEADCSGEDKRGRISLAMTSKSGVSYEGETNARGLPHGRGSASQDGRLVYDGEWDNGKYHGNGRHFQADGSEYEGAFVDGQRCGRGTFTFLNGSKYVGEFGGGKFHGEGTLRHHSGNRYEGDWVMHKKQGNGTWFFLTGERYEGEWFDDKKQGRGIWHFGNGDMYEGTFEDDQRHGSGRFFRKKLEKWFDQMYDRDELVEIPPSESQIAENEQELGEDGISQTSVSVAAPGALEATAIEGVSHVGSSEIEPAVVEPAIAEVREEEGVVGPVSVVVPGIAEVREEEEVVVVDWSVIEEVGTQNTDVEEEEGEGEVSSQEVDVSVEEQSVVSQAAQIAPDPVPNLGIPLVRHFVADPISSNRPERNPVIVIDNGSSMTKIGYAGNNKPDFIFPTCVAVRDFSDVDLATQTANLHDLDFVTGKEASGLADTHNLCFPVQNGQIVDWNGIEKLWGRIFFHYLRTDPSDHFVMLTEGLWNTKLSREKSAEIMFETFGVAGLRIWTQAVLALASSWTSPKSEQLGLAGSVTGVVVEVGESMTQLVAIVDGVVGAVDTFPVGGGHVTDFMRGLIQDREEMHIARMEVEKIKQQHCFISSNIVRDFLKFDQSPEENGRHCSFVKPGNRTATTVDVFYERFLGPESFFNPEICGVMHKLPLPATVSHDWDV